MANLQDLKPSITKIPVLMQMDLHEEIRVSRMVTKTLRTKAATKRRTEKREGFGALNSLNRQQAESLLRMLKAKGLINDY